MSKRVLALIAALVATSIFWIVSLFIKNEKIKKEHWPRLLLSALFGMVLNMLFFFKGLSLSTPINSSVIVTITPILVFVLSALLIREKITWLKGSGAVIGLFGGLTLILFGVQQQVDAPNIPLGNAMIFINAMSYGMFLIVAKPLTKTYHPVTLMRWLFLTAIIINLPIGWTEFVSVEWQALPFSAIWRIGFVIVGTTFLTYLLNIFALKYLSASTIGVFVYLQPVIAIAFAIISGADELNGLKIISAILVFLGVFMVTKNPSRKRAKA
jgi:drug/metabolite transporter (DMT)-like permease